MNTCIAQTCMPMQSHMNTHVPVVFLNSTAYILSERDIVPKEEQLVLGGKNTDSSYVLKPRYMYSA